MSEEPSARREWRIGELAAATGLSVRALRHYEQVGLLAPSNRTDGGHRVYDQHDLDRLYRICALKSLGMPLAEIAGALDGASLSGVLHQHLDHVEAEARRLVELRDRLRWLAAHADEPVPPDRLIVLIEAVTKLERVLSPTQLTRLAERRSRLGEDGARVVREDWIELGTLLRAQMDAGAAPSSAAVRPLAERARGYIHAFTGGDPGMQRALEGLRAHVPAAGVAGWDGALIDYLHRALAALPPSAPLAPSGRVGS